MNIAISILAGVGALTVSIILFSMIRDAIEAIQYRIAKKKWEDAYTHRFDKPPVAKCYCNDCRHYNAQTRECVGWDKRFMKDNDFCSAADPRKLEDENSN